MNALSSQKLPACLSADVTLAGREAFVKMKMLKRIVSIHLFVWLRSSVIVPLYTEEMVGLCSSLIWSRRLCRPAISSVYLFVFSTEFNLFFFFVCLR